MIKTTFTHNIYIFDFEDNNNIINKIDKITKLFE